MTNHFRTLALAAAVGLAAVLPAARAEEKKTAADPAAQPAAGKAEGAAAAKAELPKADADGTIPLFNGKDLTGWEGLPDFWSVQDGAIQGRTTAEKTTKGNTFLVWTAGEVADFELTFKYKIVGGNSGVQYRSKLTDPKAFVVGGYQADFEAGTTYSGILYEERGRGILAKRGQRVTLTADGKKKEEALPMSTEELQKAIKKEDWNDYTIIAKGGHLVHMINGNMTAEVMDESGKGAKSGILALQLHAGPPMTVQFKDLKLKVLDGGAKQ